MLLDNSDAKQVRKKYESTYFRRAENSLESVSKSKQKAPE